ncbi:Uncharacterized protein P5673_014773 [Acropora cervicornis]|uniref:Uncharacterized protein n=1 Tax=Acropora cervicornis TaxID=6130 RepID=A0AAD9QIP1_ACRCE|nr:Uncharacterized protein P5673_014773 [Acropora cervicornis]
MALDVSHLSKLQRELYNEKYGFDKLSRNFQSAPIHDPLRRGRITTFPDRYSRHLEQADIQVKCPWGRARSYAGEAPVCLPADHRPKWEPPDLLQKGHRHYGSGASPHPRMPRPTTANVQEGQIVLPFPKESPMSSHMSRQAMFPKPEQSLSPIPPPVILNKAMGSFGRREVITPMVNSRTVTPPKYQVKPVQVKDNWFSKHEVTSQFNKLHPSATPTIRLNIQRRRRADWQLVQ